MRILELSPRYTNRPKVHPPFFWLKGDVHLLALISNLMLSPDSYILIVEDEESLAETLTYNLEREGFAVKVVADGTAALETFRAKEPTLVLLDLMLPRMSGLDVCRILRSESSVPIIMVTAKTAEADKVAGLEMGADDYITKPFSMRELLSRVRAQLRRASMKNEGPLPSSRLNAGPIEIDLEKHEVWIRGKLADLPPKEFALLEAFVSRPGRLVTRDILMSEVWGADYYGDTRTLDVHVRRLRSKMELDPHQPRHLKTVRGLGYKFEP